MPEKKSVVKNYMYNLIYQILILVLPLITTPYLSRVLGAEGVGIYGYTYAITTYFVLFGSLGISLYGQREIAYAQNNRTKRKQTFIELILFRFITIILAMIIYFIFFIKGQSYQTYYSILLIEIVATAFDISWFFQGLEEFKKTVFRNVLVRSISVALVFILVKTQADLWKYMLIYSLADLFGNLLLWTYLPKYLKGKKVKHINITRHIVPVLLLFVPQVANKIYNLLDTTMIGALVADKAETGYYEQGQKVIRLLLTIVTSLGIVMVPRMASTFAEGDKGKIKKYLQTSFSFVFIISVPLMFGISSVAKDFVPIFFGNGYDKVAILIAIFSPMLILMGIENVIGTQYLLPTKRQKEFTYSVVYGILTNIILNAVLITFFNSIGASIATVLAQLVVDSVQIYFVRNEIKFKPIIRNFIRYFIAGFIMFVVCQIVKVIISTNAFNGIIIAISGNGNGSMVKHVISIILQVIAGSITYFSMLYVLRDKYFYMIVNKISMKLLKKEII